MLDEVEFSLAFISLYVSFGLIGKLKRNENITKVNDIVVYILIFSISLWAGSSVSINELLSLVLYSVLGSVIIIVVTYEIGTIWKMRGNVKVDSRKTNQLQYKYGIPFLLGWIVGLIVKPDLAYSTIIDVELLALAVFLGYSTANSMTIKVIRGSLSKGGISLLIVIIGNLIAGVIFHFIGMGSLKLTEIIAMGSGWYTFTGPLVSTYYSPYYGSIAFLINFFREQLSYVILPFLLRIRYNPYSAIAVGGATSMDTTLPLYALLLGDDYVMTAVFSGVTLTVFIPIFLPLMLNLP
ncbi:lysine exporter LysO family protein [Sulfuracidifex tepidarius]|uniref:lysine exporter LysO family protein n=1 Tax=Sulfuracidifex tepidarius TaxID=1294262 RepID=UPI0006CF82B8|nr:lysine exporter LysO family protein [Sulfuracidifex tepidarius]